jgi:hypothetical protein
MTRTIDNGGRVDELPIELAARKSDGLEVTLLWEKRRNRVFVVVADIRSGDCFSLPAATGREALDVFYHPFASAPERTQAQPAPTPP